MHKQPPWFWLVLWFLPLAAHAQDVFTLTADGLQRDHSVELIKLAWKYSPDDDLRFAEPQFDDRAWETLQGTAITLNHVPKSGWHGIGWFRLRFKVDPALANQPLALALVQYGASEVYLDGKLVQSFGTVGTAPEKEIEYDPGFKSFALTLNNQPEHVLAIRHSCMAMRDFNNRWDKWILNTLSFFSSPSDYRGAGFEAWVVEPTWASDIYYADKVDYKYEFLRGGLFLAIGLLHLLLFGFYPRQRANLYFGIFALLSFANSQFLDLQSDRHWGTTGRLFMFVWSVILTPVNSVILLAFINTAFSPRLPKQFWIWFSAAVCVIFFQLFYWSGSFWWVGTAFRFGVLFEVLRVSVQAIRRKINGAWIVFIGTCIYVLGALLDYTFIYAYFPVVPHSVNRVVSILCLVFSMSVFLARQFARTSHDLEAQLVQVKQLSAAALEHEKVKAEHDRKTKELEEARQLQLSMLPKKLPNLPHLDIAAFMKTATEVGGDYYDFHLGEDGTLTIAVGDATGHGLKAGTMVTAVKSLFDTLAYHPDIPHIFERLTRTLKRMNLRGLFMALTVAKINQHQLVLSVAGMPPVLLYRAALSQVEVVELKALPLGGVVNYRYQQLTLELAAGDVVVLMSDGLPERFNAQDEMLGYEPVQELLAQVGTQTATDIIAALIQAGDNWAGARPQDDDVTFVIVKVKEA